MDKATLLGMKVPGQIADYLLAMDTRLQAVEGPLMAQMAAGPVDEAAGKALIAEVRQVIASDKQDYRHLILEQAKQEVGAKVETALRWYGPEGDHASEVLGKALDGWTEAGMPTTGFRAVPAPTVEATL